MTMHVKFLGKGSDNNKGQICLHSPIYDSTLCGYTMDGDDQTAGEYVMTDEKINCQQCIQIVKYCKTVKNARL